MEEIKHHIFLNHIASKLQAYDYFLGLAIGGSFLSSEVDEFSDLDLVVVVDEENYDKVVENHKVYLKEFGNYISSFTGEHVGVSNLIIAMYNDTELLHVDVKFITLEGLKQRIEDPYIVWEREDVLTNAMELTQFETPPMDVQWMEDHFWTWIHYAATKIGRGEYFEAINTFNFLREQILCPLLALRHGLPTWRGVRKIEKISNSDYKKLEQTLAVTNFDSCKAALSVEIKLYQELREELFIQKIDKNEEMELLVVDYIDKLSNGRFV